MEKQSQTVSDYQAQDPLRPEVNGHDPSSVQARLALGESAAPTVTRINAYMDLFARVDMIPVEPNPTDESKPLQGELLGRNMFGNGSGTPIMSAENSLAVQTSQFQEESLSLGETADTSGQLALSKLRDSPELAEMIKGITGGSLGFEKRLEPREDDPSLPAMLAELDEIADRGEMTLGPALLLCISYTEAPSTVETRPSGLPNH